MEKKVVSDWDVVVHKNVRASDGAAVGNIVAILGDAIQVETQGSRGQYLIPKANVATFDGAEVRLDTPFTGLSEFRRP
ncbi:MAG TPA: DUF2171 domain-containing protein [Nitrososphaera sp.]|nr:DUF2171 domain-containing protein [Nitrososphaera sp.]